MHSLGLIGRTLNNTTFLDDNGVISGEEILKNKYIEYLLKYSSIPDFHFINFKYSYNQACLLRAQKNYTGDKKIILHDKNEIVQTKQQLHLDIMYDPDEDIKSLVLFRDLYTENKPPITYNMPGCSDISYTSTLYPQFLLTQFQKYDSFICNSTTQKKVVETYINESREYFKRQYGMDLKYDGRIDVVPLGVDTTIFRPLPKAQCRKELNLPEDAFIILYHARIDFYYKADLIPMLITVRKLVERYGNVVLVISGNDNPRNPHFKSIQRYIRKYGLKDHVIFMEQRNHNETAAVYSACDVFTSPIDNIQETFGFAPIEAMACGTPQVVSDWDGYKETVVDGVTGIRVPTYWCECDQDISCMPFIDCQRELIENSVFSHYLLSQSVAVDIDAYVEAFSRLIEHPELREKMAENSRRTALEKFDWKVVVKQTEDLWLELIEVSREEEYIETDYANHLYNSRFFQAFQSYPTYVIQPDDIVAGTQDLHDFIEKDESFILHFKYSEELLHIELVKEIGGLLAKKQPSGLSIREIVGFYRNRYSEEVIKRCVMFLMKRGLVKLYR